MHEALGLIPSHRKQDRQAEIPMTAVSIVTLGNVCHISEPQFSQHVSEHGIHGMHRYFVLFVSWGFKGFSM